jgi:hypothetical protein
MDTSAVVIIALLAVVVVVIAFLYRPGAFKAGLKVLGVRLDVEGQANPPGDATPEGKPPPAAAGASSAATGPPSQTAGDRSIQAGRDATGTFVTGDDNRIDQAGSPPKPKRR